MQPASRSENALSPNVEAVEKVVKQILGPDAEKSELIECATINDLMLREGQKGPPENHPLIAVRGFFYRLVRRRNMKTGNEKYIIERLKSMPIEKARYAIAEGEFGDIGSPNHTFASSWLSAKEASLRDAREAEMALVKMEKPINTITRVSAVADTWKDIEAEYGISKMTFGKKIKFVKDQFKRGIIFRDIGQAFVLAREGFNKPSVVLAGSVIEEMLRLYLVHKNITPVRNSLDSYIKTCDENSLLKEAIHKLADSVRQFRNIVHLEKETSPRHTISKPTALGAVASIFTIANDFV